ncbi:hypothetical protein J7L33_03045 [Candidatus Bathyarchaeota archaeon]|nr:hypothetical protein [Candidatus Bathyarchaeota archaeon]
MELNEKAKGLEDEVNRLKDELETLKGKIPEEFLQESSEKDVEECIGCEE